jgi:hypothetical protein
VRPAVVFEAAGGESALVRARALAGGDAHIEVEVWERGRRVYPATRGKAFA